MVGRLRSHWIWYREKYLLPYLLIHVNKTGGSSIEAALGLHFDHVTAVEKRAEIGQWHWDRKFKFAVVRNPWDRVVSHYHYRLMTNQTGLGDRRIGFSDWVRLVYEEGDPRYRDQEKMFMPQSRWICDSDDKVLVDYVGRFERLEADFQEICRVIKKKATLPHLKRSNRGDYSTYYDDRSRTIVADYFDEDIERFGYTF